MKTALTLLTALLALIALLAWSPWITQAYAEHAAAAGFASAWEGVVDGCGFNCQGCGVQGSQRVLFGVSVRLEYACGLLPQDSPEYHQTQSAFVSPLGTVHDLPAP